MMYPVEREPAGETPHSHVLELTVDGAPVRALLRDGEVLLVGRDPSCQVVVPDRVVSRRHAQISREAGTWVVRDLGSRNGIHVDGRRAEVVTVTDRASLRLGDPHTGPVLTVAIPSPRPPSDPVSSPLADAAPSPTLVSASPPDTRPAAAPALGAITLTNLPRLAGRERLASFETDDTVTIGRDPSNHIVLPDLLVSRRHAQVRRTKRGYLLVDLGSTNGTYHNGQRVHRTRLQAGDLVAIGHYQLVFDGQRLHEQRDTGPVSLTAERVTVRIGNKTLVNDVSFALGQGSLVGIIGPSGCGKSTLLRAITGLRRASAGRISYDGRDLYADYAELRYRIAAVPQEDVLHRQLTVRRALRFAASLRFASDVSRRERNERVEEVMATLGIERQARQRIDRLSGGQRKRVSVAMELLTEPSLLCLDEPTSGPGPGAGPEVMRQLRSLADRGRTVLCVTHNVLHLDMCDRILVLCPGGTTGYFGPPSQLLSFFGADSYADVFAKVTEAPQEWTRRYRESDLHRRYVAEPITAAWAASFQQPLAATEPEPDQEPPASDSQSGWPAGLSVPAPVARSLNLGRPSMAERARHPVAPLRQFGTLCRRMLRVISADRGYLLFLAGLPLALALLSHAVPGETGLGPPRGFSLEAQRLLVVLVVGAAFLGISSSIREIVHEGPIYQRERAVGLSPGAYLAAKFVVLGIINVLQVSAFVYLSLLGRGGPAQALVLGSPMLEVIVPVAMVTTSCTMFGLCVSALARSVAQTTPLLVIVVMAMLVLSGGLFELAGEAVLNQVSWLSPTRWGFAAGAATVDLMSMVPISDPLWVHEPSSWWRAITVLAVQIVVLTAAARLAMRRLEPGGR